MKYQGQTIALLILLSIIIQVQNAFGQKNVVFKDTIVYRFTFRDTIVYRYDTVRIRHFVHSDTV